MLVINKAELQISILRIKKKYAVKNSLNYSFYKHSRRRYSHGCKQTADKMF